MMSSLFRRELLLLSLFLLLPGLAAAQDAWCINCFTSHQLPGQWIGLYRLQKCGCCEDNCDHAKEHAEQLRRSYKRYRDALEKIRQEIAQLKSAGKSIPNDLAAREADLGNPNGGTLAQLELQWQMLQQACPKEVQGNIWDGYGGPIGTPPKDSAARERRAAENSARVYDGLSQQYGDAFDAFVGFLGNSGVASRPTGFNGERAQVTRGSRQLAERYRLEAARPIPPVAPTDKKHKERVKPDLKTIKIPAKATDVERWTASALEGRLNALAFSTAYLESLARFRAAQAAGDKDAMLNRAQDARLYAWSAREWGITAARSEQKAFASELSAWDADLLGKFQAKVKADGVPELLRDALRTAGADAGEMDAARKRLLEIKPEQVETLLKNRRAWVQERAQLQEDKIIALDRLSLEADYLIACVLYPEARKKSK